MGGRFSRFSRLRRLCSSRFFLYHAACDALLQALHWRQPSLPTIVLSGVYSCPLRQCVFAAPFLAPARERGVDRLAGLLICRDRVNGRGRESFVFEGLLDDGQVDVAGDKGKPEGVFEAVRMPPVGWKPGGLRDRLEGAKELRAVNPSALLGDK